MKRLIYFCLPLLAVACGESFLEKKPALNQQVPRTVADYLGLMDSHEMMNANSSHILGFIGNDEYYITDAEYASFPAGGNNAYQKNAYTWNDIIYEGTESFAIDWDRAFARILWANLVLEGMEKLTVSAQEAADWKLAKGAALFFRALNYYTLAQLYAPVYGENANELLGLPIRRETDITEQLSRSSLADTYAFIIKDLEEAAVLLPDLPFPPFIYRPSKWAVYALQCRLYMQMGDYTRANAAADACLAIKAGLLDFNTLDTTQINPFPEKGESNPEVILNTTLDNGVTLTRVFYHPDTLLLESYKDGDLRRQLYFDSTSNDMFSGSYDGSGLYFTGFATDEIYLNKAECEARLGNAPAALALVNELSKHRFRSDDYEPYDTGSPTEVLALILDERRKELVMRGTRWEDLRRLNKEEDYAKVIVRNLNGDQVVLLPSDKKYVWPIPPDAIDRGNYRQNER